MSTAVLRHFLSHLGLELEIKRIPREGFPTDAFLAQKELLKRASIDSPMIFDIGSNTGRTVRGYAEAFPRAIIHCFEPLPSNVNNMRVLFQGNSRIHIHEIAVADCGELRTFYTNRSNSEINSLLPRETVGRRYFSKTAILDGKITVASTSLDTFCETHQIEKIDLLKFDIQGGELIAFRGMTSLLMRHAISVIFTEAFFSLHYQGSPLLRDLWNYLTEFGYSLFNLYNHVRARNGQLRFADALFVSPTIRHQVLDSYPDES